jgi:hypothetical protein
MHFPAAITIAVVTTLALMTAVQPVRAETHAETGVSVNLKIDLLRQITDAVGAAGEALSRLADGIKHAVDTKTAFETESAARNTHDRLLALSKDVLAFREHHNAMTLTIIETFVDAPNAANWDAIMRHAQTTLSEALLLQKKLDAENSEFVLKPAYETLSMALEGRVSLLTQLEQLSFPSTPQELEIMRGIATKCR